MSYLLTIRIPFESMDDPAARQKAAEHLSEVSAIFPEADVKLQETFSDKPPRNIKF